MKIKVAYSGQAESGKMLEVGEEVEYVGHVPGGGVAVLLDGVKEYVSPYCFNEFR